MMRILEQFEVFQRRVQVSRHGMHTSHMPCARCCASYRRVRHHSRSYLANKCNDNCGHLKLRKGQDLPKGTYFLPWLNKEGRQLLRLEKVTQSHRLMKESEKLSSLPWLLLPTDGRARPQQNKAVTAGICHSSRCAGVRSGWPGGRRPLPPSSSGIGCLFSKWC